MNVLCKQVCLLMFLNIMMLGAHLTSSGRKFQSEAAAVSINLFQNLAVLLRFGTSGDVFADLR